MDWNAAYESGEYRKHWDSSQPSPELAGFISAMQPQNGKGFLDIGCGSGEDTIFAARYFENSVGIDISSKAIELASDKALANNSRAKFIRADLNCLPFGGSMFNMVSDRGCLHNLTFEMWASYEKEVYRVLKPGGTLFLRGARKFPSYGENFSFIEPENIQDYFSQHRWKIRGPFNITMYSDADDGCLLSNLFVLDKL